MTTTKLYLGGLPTDPQIRKLDERYPDPKAMRGSIITHDELAAVIGEPKKSNRYHTIVSRWRRNVWNRTGVVISGRGEAKGLGFRVLLDGEQVQFGIGERKSAGRKIIRWHSAVANTDESNLTAADRKTREHEMFAAAKMHAAMIETRRPVMLPEPGNGSPKASPPLNSIWPGEAGHG